MRYLTMSSYRGTQMLIAEIQKRPLLWDPATEDYKDKNKKAAAWIDICRSLTTGFDQKPIAEQDKLEKESKARWKSIRDSFTKDRKKRLSESKSKSLLIKSRPYVFSEQLSFLLKVVDNEDILDRISLTQESGEEKEDFESSEEFEIAPKTDIDPSPQTPVPVSLIKVDKSQQATRCRFGSNSRKRKLEDRIIKLTQSTLNAESERNDELRDPDKDFFMSMLPSVKTLNEDQKLEFRMQVILALQNVKSGGSRYSIQVNPDYHTADGNISFLQQ